jgi:hypothetical protein
MLFLNLTSLAAKTDMKILGRIVPSKPSLSLIDYEGKNVKTCFTFV